MRRTPMVSKPRFTRSQTPGRYGFLSRSTRCWMIGFLAIGLSGVLAVVAIADDSTAAPSDSTAIDWVGINGHYRAGHWTAVHIEKAVVSLAGGPLQSSGERPSKSPGTQAPIVLETTDGDGVVAQFSQKLVAGSDFGYCVPGTEAAPLTIRADATSSDDILLKSRFPEQGVPANGPSMIPLGMPWVVVIGDSLNVDTIGANDLLDRDASVAVTKVTDAESVPDHVLGLSGVDLILITGSGRDVLDQISPVQSTAITNWVRAGGRLVVTLGASAKQTLQASPWLADLLPESVSQAAVVRLDPSGMETFTNSQTRLSEFDGIRLPKVTSLTGGRSSQIGETLIAGRTARRISVPLASRYVSGLGKVLVVAADLEKAPFDDWPERFDLVTKLAAKELSDQRGDASSSIRLSGYSDLSGQVRRSLDQFPIKRGLNFSVIALVIAALVILVAPLDYFVVRRLLGSSLWGWATFPIVAVAMSIGLVMASQPQAEIAADLATTASTNAPMQESSALDPSVDPAPRVEDGARLRSNSIEVLDLDTSTATGRLFRWAFLYSHAAQKVDVDGRPNAALDALTSSVDYQTMRPFGTPGVSMGGIQIDSWSDAIEVPLSPIAVSSNLERQDRPGISSHVKSLQLAPRGSKSLALSMQFQADVTTESVKRRGGSELLQGELTNPLKVDLLEAMLVYQNWVYLLPTRFPAGATVEDVDRLRQKNFRWQLSRQRALESSSEGESWDVIRTDQPKRLAEMLMFHDAVGGIRYTGLRHEVLGDLDLSEMLTEDRCLLVGRCREPWTTLDVRPSDASEPADSDTVMSRENEPIGQTTSWVRVLIPVEELRR